MFISESCETDSSIALVPASVCMFVPNFVCQTSYLLQMIVPNGKPSFKLTWAHVSPKSVQGQGLSIKVKHLLLNSLNGCHVIVTKVHNDLLLALHVALLLFVCHAFVPAFYLLNSLRDFEIMFYINF